MLPIDVRAASSVAGDIRDARDTRIELRGTIASAVVCDTAGGGRSCSRRDWRRRDLRQASLSAVAGRHRVGARRERFRRRVATVSRGVERRVARGGECAARGPQLERRGARDAARLLALDSLTPRDARSARRFASLARFATASIAAPTAIGISGSATGIRRASRFNTDPTRERSVPAAGAGGLAFRYLDSAGTRSPTPVVNTRVIARRSRGSAARDSGARAGSRARRRSAQRGRASIRAALWILLAQPALSARSSRRGIALFAALVLLGLHRAAASAAQLAAFRPRRAFVEARAHRRAVLDAAADYALKSVVVERATRLGSTRCRLGESRDAGCLPMPDVDERRAVGRGDASRGRRAVARRRRHAAALASTAAGASTWWRAGDRSGRSAVAAWWRAAACASIRGVAFAVDTAGDADCRSAPPRVGDDGAGRDGDVPVGGVSVDRRCRPRRFGDSIHSAVAQLAGGFGVVHVARRHDDHRRLVRRNADRRRSAHDRRTIHRVGLIVESRTDRRARRRIST